MKATKEQLRREIAELRSVGGSMSNVCFNLGQRYDPRCANRSMGRQMTARRKAIVARVCDAMQKVGITRENLLDWTSGQWLDLLANIDQADGGKDLPVDVLAEMKRRETAKGENDERIEVYAGWRFDAELERILDSTGQRVVTVGLSLSCGRSNDAENVELLANARLIAAAPALYDALKQLTNAAYRPCGHTFDCACPQDAARAAIAAVEEIR